MRKHVVLAVPAVLIAATASIAPSVGATALAPIGTSHHPLAVPAAGFHRYASFTGHSKTLARAYSTSMTLAQASKDLAFPVADDQIKSVRFVSSHSTLSIRVRVRDLHKVTEANGMYTLPVFDFGSVGNNSVVTSVFVDRENHAEINGGTKGAHVSVVRGINGTVTLTIPRTHFPAKDKTERIQVISGTALTTTDYTELASWGNAMRAPYTGGVFVDAH